MHLSLPQRVLDCALSSLLPHAACDKGRHDRLGLCGCRRRPSLVYISLTAHSIKQGISENVAYFILELLTIPVLSTGLTDHPPRGRLESHLQCLLSGSWYDKFSEFRQTSPWSFSSVILTTKILPYGAYVIREEQPHSCCQCGSINSHGALET